MSNSFTVGINLAWLDGAFDHDFGSNEVRKISTPAYATAKSKQNWNDYLEDISSMGVKVVRLWLFERFEGLEFIRDETGAITGTVKKIKDDFKDNLRKACKVAQSKNIKFYFCLLETYANYDKELSKKQKIALTRGQKKEYVSIINGLITDRQKSKSLIDAVIALLTDPIIKKSVWAVDVLNEPEGLEPSKILRELKVDLGVPWKKMIPFIKYACTEIKSGTGHKVSCGFQYPRNVLWFAIKLKDAVDFFDFHVYRDDGFAWVFNRLFAWVYNRLLSKPCYIGECGQKTLVFNDQSQADRIQADSVKNFLNYSKDKHYAGCFVWFYNCKEWDSTIPENNLSLIYQNGKRRPVVEKITDFIQNNIP